MESERGEYGEKLACNLQIYMMGTLAYHKAGDGWVPSYRHTWLSIMKTSNERHVWAIIDYCCDINVVAN